jgi:spore coat polysaccharide biosynthesis predicted glycosyltransferase SpsG
MLMVCGRGNLAPTLTKSALMSRMNQLKQQQPKLLIIGKGGKKEGMGHLVRISALVETLAPNYLVTVLVKQDRFGEFFFKQKGIDCFTYQDNRGLYLFLGKTTRTGKYAVVIIDIYRISINVIKRIENYCDFLVNFDDMQRRLQYPINGVFLCPQEPFNWEIESRGATVVAKGTDFFPLRQIFAQYREQHRFKKNVNNMGIILGGVPSKTYTLQLIRLLDHFLDKTVNLHAVMGFDPGEIHNQAFSSRVHIEKNVDNMAAFITEMDMGIIAGGFIKFEFMCIGTPFLLVSLCHHQQKLARKFASKGYGAYLGEIKHLIANPGKFRRKIESFLSNDILRVEMFENSRRLVDGQGSSRILEMVNTLTGHTPP